MPQWKVLYKDRSSEEGSDNLSKSAFNNPDIKSFILITDYYISIVNLEDGSITFGTKNNSIVSEFTIHSPFEKENYRLIYYRKKSISINQGIQVGEDIPYIGWQITKNGINYKRIFKITDKIILEE